MASGYDRGLGDPGREVAGPLNPLGGPAPPRLS